LGGSFGSTLYRSPRYTPCKDLSGRDPLPFGGLRTSLSAGLLVIVGGMHIRSQLHDPIFLDLYREFRESGNYLSGNALPVHLLFLARFLSLALSFLLFVQR
jgi:hypothetical protein